MDESSSDNESLYARIQELEQERDELQKDIEQLCMQQAGPSYIAFANQIHIRRTAGLEQEMENLKKKLAACTKENFDLKEELSEAKRIKTHLDQLHKLEVAKNTEVVKQLEYLRGAVANAFADRDQAIVEAEKAKENEDMMSQKVSDAEKRLQELTVRSIETQEQLMSLQTKLAKQEQEIGIFRKIIDKFYKIRQHACRGSEDEESGWENLSDGICLDDKCECLCNDPPEAWSFNVHQDASTAGYIAALQEELETLRGSVDDLQNKLQMGLDIEKHLKWKLRVLEQKKILSDRLIIDGISSLRKYHSEQRIHMMDLLDDGKSYLQSVAASIEEMIRELSKDTGSTVAAEVSDNMQNISQTVDLSDTLARASQEKVSALLLLSQEEERHVFERNVYAAVQETLKQATEEKVKALMELAAVKQEYQLLLERTTQDRRQGNLLPKSGERRIVAPGGGKLKNLWNRTSLKRLLGPEENLPPVAHLRLDDEGSLTKRGSNRRMDDARMQIENATLKDSMHSLERLTSDIRERRLCLMQAKETSASEGTSSGKSRRLDEIIREAELLKTALCSALPVSWSGEGDMASSGDVITEDDRDHEGSNSEKIDVVSAAGLEMVELLILAALILKDEVAKRDQQLRIR